MIDSSLENLKQLLQYLGCDKRQSELFVALFQKSNRTLLELSKDTGIPRSTLYRLIEPLKERGLVEEIIEEYRPLYRACPLTRIEQLVQDAKEQSRLMEKLLPSVAKLQVQSSISQPQTKVLMYRGREGIRQMVWNVLSTQTEVLGFTYRILDDFVGATFMNRWREEFRLRQIHGRDIITKEYLKSVEGRYKAVDWGSWQTKIIDSSLLTIDHQVDIYDNIVAYYTWHKSDIFGVEIHNPRVAQMQSQLFELAWERAIRHE